MKFLLNLLFFVFVLQTHAQTDTKKTTHQLGLHFGTTTGVGFSYRCWLERFGFQATTLPSFTSTTTQKRFFLSVGASLLWKFSESETVDFFGYLGNHFAHFNSSDNLYALGVGTGVYIKTLEVLNLNFQIGYGLYNTDTFFTNLAFETGIYYSF